MSFSHSVPLENLEVDFFVSFYEKSASAVRMPLLRFKQGRLQPLLRIRAPRLSSAFTRGFYEASFYEALAKEAIFIIAGLSQALDYLKTSECPLVAP